MAWPPPRAGYGLPRPGRTRNLLAAPEPSGPVPAYRGDVADAAALAAAFAADYLSWNEADPARRGRALASYATASVSEEELAVAGWPGRGRQRAELALPGTVVRLSPARVLVHVRVRVTPFRRRADVPAGPRSASGDVLAFPAGAPAPAHPQWEGLDSYWYELLIPLLACDDRWRVDIGTVIVVPPLPDGDTDPADPDAGERGS